MPAGGGGWAVGPPREQLAAYMANGASLGWLLLPQSRTVEVWTAAETANSPLVLHDPAKLEAGLEFPGLVMEQKFWQVMDHRLLLAMVWICLQAL